ncbi:MAG: helix-turn-helix domain-containing protein [Oligoflexia bacterium]|nr:helix-turn-helix domain-containing protein [Oligoflexia bacterium]
MKRKILLENTEKLLEIVAILASSIGQKSRLKILQLLSQAPRSVEVLAELSGEAIANTSQHLRRLYKNGLVSVRKDKLSRIYSLKDKQIAFFIENLFDLAEHISNDYLHSSNQITEEEIKNQKDIPIILEEIRNKKAILLDVRDAYESKYSSVEGALTIPLEQLLSRAQTFSKNKIYYLFCRGRICQAATEGVNILRELGLKAFRLQESPLTLKHLIEESSNGEEK